MLHKTVIIIREIFAETKLGMVLCENKTLILFKLFIKQILYVRGGVYTRVLLIIKYLPFVHMHLFKLYPSNKILTENFVKNIWRILLTTN